MFLKIGNFINKKDSYIGVSCESCEIFKNTFFTVRIG